MPTKLSRLHKSTITLRGCDLLRSRPRSFRKSSRSPRPELWCSFLSGRVGSVEDEIAASRLEEPGQDRHRDAASSCAAGLAALAKKIYDQIRDSLLRDAETLTEGGVHGLMMENFGDVPFYPDRVPAHVIAQMTMLACKVREAIDLPLGINVLRNDGRGALAVAQASGASFIRVNVLCGARVADQGLIQGIAHDLLRERAILSATISKSLPTSM